MITYGKNREKLEMSFHDQLIKDFLSVANNREIAYKCMESPSSYLNEEISLSFKKFYFDIRFSSFLSSTIRFSKIDFTRRKRRYFNRNVFIMDQPVSNNNETTTFGDLFESKHTTPTVSEAQEFLNEDLQAAFCKLTEKQKFVIILVYVQCLKDTEISKRLKISQQAVTKTKKNALLKLRKELIRKGALNNA